MRRTPLATLAAIIALADAASAGEWLLPPGPNAPPRWGRTDGIAFALHPAPIGRPQGPAGAARGTGGPRGLIRIGYPVHPDGDHALINFIAIEPIVRGSRGYSEMEGSATDGQPGKVIEPIAPASLDCGADGVERLEVHLRVESFRNGAKVRLRLSVRADRPDELAIEAEPDEGSAPMQRCILTATMGNMIRARHLWLADGVVACADLYPGFSGDDFAPHRRFALPTLLRTPDGGIFAAMTTDESDPSSVFPFDGTKRWHYPGPPLTQYWRKEKGAFGDDLAAVVNARATYWATQQPIPGGPAFENFELSEPFRPGRPTLFGITRKTPKALGFPDGPAKR